MVPSAWKITAAITAGKHDSSLPNYFQASFSTYSRQEHVVASVPHQALDVTNPDEEEEKEFNFERIDGDTEVNNPPGHSKQHDTEEEDEDEGSGVGSNEDSLPELFQPSSPLEINKNFILPDIMEESETDQSESMRSSLLSSDGTMVQSQKFATKFNPFEETGLDVVETNFSDDVPLPDDDDAKQDQNSSGSPQEPPILPVSPPPGPLLSPRYSMLLFDNEQFGDSNRFSVVSVSDEMAPPLPTSLPPGKLIPRQSLYQDSESKMDLWYELNKTEGQPRENLHSDDLKSQTQLQDDSKSSSRPEEELDPTLNFGKYGVMSSHQLTEHLTSDSGFPETDMTATHSDHSTGRTTEQPASSSSHNHPLSISTKNSSTSVTSYSDERTTEYSGSIGIKTNASSSSQVQGVNVRIET